MNFSNLLTILKEYHPCIHTLTDGNDMLYGAFPVSNDENAMMERNILYVIDANKMNRHFFAEKDTLINLLAFGEVTDIPKDLSLRKLNLIYVDKQTNRDHLMNSLFQAISLDMSIHDSMRILTDALFANRGNQHLLNRGHDLIQNPIFQIDRAGNSILFSYDDEDIKCSPLLKKMINDLKTPNESLKSQVLNKYLIHQEDLVKLHDNPELECIRSFHPIFGKEQITTIIRIRKVEVATLTVLALRKPFTSLDEQLVYRLGVLIGQELQKRSLYTKNRNEVKAQFLNYLLTSHNLSNEFIHQKTRIQKIVDLKEQFYVAVISNSSEKSEIDYEVFDVLTSQLQPLLQNSFYLIRDAELVILFNLSDDIDIHNFADRILKERVVSFGFMVGVSNVFFDLKETEKHYQQAKKALFLGIDYPDWVITYFSVIAPIEALRVIDRHDNLLAYCMPEVLKLLKHDTQNNSDLITTLWIYLENFGNTTRSAQQLYIHKNTLLYRISKIKEILHSNLENGEDIYKIMMSLRILRILRLYKLPEEYIISET